MANYIESPLDRIVDVHFGEEEPPPIAGSTQITPNTGYPIVLGWTNAGFSFIVISQSGELSYDRGLGLLFGVAGGIIAGSMDVSFNAAGGVGEGTVQYGMRATPAGGFLWTGPIMSVGGSSGPVGPFTVPSNGRVELVYQVLSASGNEHGLGISTGGDSPGFALTLHG